MVTKRKKKSESIKAQDIINALGSITKEKSISATLVLDSLKDAIMTAARKYLGTLINVEVNIDRDKGTIEAYTLQHVVETVEDPETQINLTDAKKIDSDLEIGDEVVTELDIEEFGRSAIQTAKQIITQRVKEHERQKIYADYSQRVGEIVTGTVQQIEKNNLLINLGRTEAMLPAKEQIRKERYRQGDTVRGVIINVISNPKGPQVIISRTSPIFVERLFEIEVPEIFEKIVQIVKVVRAPGFRAKIAVKTNDPRVDPVGACVGMRGNRVQAIVRELSNERMDIINWTDEVNLLVRRVFTPAEIKRVLPIDERRIVVLVSDKDLAQAIGKDGQNIRLASRLIDKEIDMYGEKEFEDFTEERKQEIFSKQAAPVQPPLVSETTNGEDIEAHPTADTGAQKTDEPADVDNELNSEDTKTFNQ
ncbi:MAG: transcription termination factor NusA [Chitinivibrionales bacterium]|nr:transcription termination factor NusA [Chitinivibrionales bacterium]